MKAPTSDHGFSGSIPQLYNQFLVPLIFASYADDLADRVVLLKPSNVLELAAGTGVVTRRLAAKLPAIVPIVATDLNRAMLDQAASVGTSRPVTWQQADAMALPFPDESFDAVACQFGVMFFPDKAAAFAEARRVLRPGGTFIFNVWDQIERNELTHCIEQVLAGLFPDDPPQFMSRTPHGYYDEKVIARDLALGGFEGAPTFHTLAARSKAESPRVPAIALCQGTPLRSEIEARAPARLAEVTDAAAEEIARRFGRGPVDARIQGLVVTVAW